MTSFSSLDKRKSAGDTSSGSDSNETAEKLHTLSLSQLPMYSGHPWMSGGRFLPYQTTRKPWLLDTTFSKVLHHSRPSASPSTLTQIIQASTASQRISITNNYRGDFAVHVEPDAMALIKIASRTPHFAPPVEEDVVESLLEQANGDDNGDDGETTEEITGEYVMDDCDTDDEFELVTEGTSLMGQPIFPPIINSIMPNIPPVLRFVRDTEIVSPLPSSLSKKLLWRNSTLTPNVVKRALIRSNFRIITMAEDITEDSKANWIGCFGKRLTPNLFRHVQDFQKINHFPGSFQIGRKDRLSINLGKMRSRFGHSEYNFYPPTFHIPREIVKLKTFTEQCMESRLFRNQPKNRGGPRWIVKPPAAARGVGIYVVSKISDLPMKRKSIAQLYISDPYLINGSKFDLRLYVYMSSVDPLQLYIHKNGLVRFASQRYSKSHHQVKNRFVHLTNYSVNKKNADYKNGNKAHERDAHKWALEELWTFLKDRGHNTDKLWKTIKSIVFKTMASVVPKIASMVQDNVARHECVHELFGFDILLDSRLTPWLLEVNVSPSLHTSSYMDNSIKSEVVVDMLNLAGFRLPPPREKIEVANNRSASRLSSVSAAAESTSRSPKSPRPRERSVHRFPVHQSEQLRYNLTENERFKHRAFTVRAQPVAALGKILECPTTDDVLVLANTLNEWYRASQTRFERIFPQVDHQSASLLRYIDSVGADGLSACTGHVGSTRYYDMLLNQFLQKYHITAAPGDVKFATATGIPVVNNYTNGNLVFGGVPVENLEADLKISRKGITYVVELAARYLPALAESKGVIGGTRVSSTRNQRPWVPPPPPRTPLRGHRRRSAHTSTLPHLPPQQDTAKPSRCLRMKPEFLPVVRRPTTRSARILTKIPKKPRIQSTKIGTSAAADEKPGNISDDSSFSHLFMEEA